MLSLANKKRTLNVYFKYILQVLDKMRRPMTRIHVKVAINHILISKATVILPLCS